MAAPVTHVLFDVDGLLLDTERLYTIATQEIVGKYGKTFTWETKIRQMGKKESEASKIIIDELDLPLTVEEYLETAHVLYEKLFPTVGVLPGAEKLVKHLHKTGVPIAVATGSTKRSMELKTINHKDLFGLFDHLVYIGCDPEIKHGKPSPDGFLIAAQRFPDNPDPKKVLVFEDAPNGVEAAHAAGMQCVWVPSVQQDVNTHKDKATQVLTSLEEFRPEDYGLPPYNNS